MEFYCGMQIVGGRKDAHPDITEHRLVCSLIEYQAFPSALMMLKISLSVENCKFSPCYDSLLTLHICFGCLLLQSFSSWKSFPACVDEVKTS